MTQHEIFNGPTIHHRKLSTLLPEVSRRVRFAEFSYQDEIAVAYAVNKSTVSKWKNLAIKRGLIDTVTWLVGLHNGRLRGAHCTAI